MMSAMMQTPSAPDFPLWLKFLFGWGSYWLAALDWALLLGAPAGLFWWLWRKR